MYWQLDSFSFRQSRTYNLGKITGPRARKWYTLPVFIKFL